MVSHEEGLRGPEIILRPKAISAVCCMQGVKSKNSSFCLLKTIWWIAGCESKFLCKDYLNVTSSTGCSIYVTLICLPSTSPAVSASNTLTPWFYAQTAVILCSRPLYGRFAVCFWKKNKFIYIYIFACNECYQLWIYCVYMMSVWFEWEFAYLCTQWFWAWQQQL